MLKKSVLILVPHPDDEINVAGSLIYDLVREKYQIFVMYSTNGDYYGEEGSIRIKEAIRALGVLGVRKENIIFLGYGDCWNSKLHIYNADAEQVMMSHGGFTHTYGIKEHPEYAYIKDKVHRLYTRSNMKADIKSVILDILPETIIAVDFDNHPDHRALSLLFEEVMGELLKEKEDYRPIVLKKFAYAGVYMGEKDYANVPMKETQRPQHDKLLDPRYELDMPAYRWQERIQLYVGEEARTKNIKDNILYKAGKEHASQNFKEHIEQIANADIVYWQRRTDGVSYQAKVSASSGYADYVNDFKLVDCSNILIRSGGSQIFDNYLWIPEKGDKLKTLYFDFKEPVNISKIVIYENSSARDNIKRGLLTFDNGNCIEVLDIDHTGKASYVVFDVQKDILHLEFKIADYEGENCGIAEFEIYENIDGPDLEFRKYETQKYNFIEKNKGNNSNKYYQLYKLLVEWDKLKTGNIEKYLQENHIKSIAIYGWGDLGEKLYKELNNSKIKIVLGVDKREGLIYAPIPLYNTIHILENRKVDAVIVTTVSVYDDIYNALREIGVEEQKIISLEELIYRVDVYL